MHRVINFNQKAWLNPCINLNKELKRNVKNNFDKDFCKLMNNAVLRKTMKNIKHHRDTKFVTTKARRELFSIRTKLS